MDTPSDASTLPRHYETTTVVTAPPEQVFRFADEQTQLSSHMSESSPMMGGGRMQVEMDEGGGHRVGSHIRLSGRAFGIPLAVEEVVIERSAPWRKVWATIGQPALIVIGHYRMGFEVAPHQSGASLRVFIDYALPEGSMSRLAGTLFSGYYAKWCAQQMAKDVAAHFGRA